MTPVPAADGYGKSRRAGATRRDAHGGVSPALHAYRAALVVQRARLYLQGTGKCFPHTFGLPMDKDGNVALGSGTSINLVELLNAGRERPESDAGRCSPREGESRSARLKGHRWKERTAGGLLTDVDAEMAAASGPDVVTDLEQTSDHG